MTSWWDRRASTGFPEPAGERPSTGVRGRTRVWDINAVLPWFLEWTPGRGGAPVGNSNARTHGRYSGKRDASAGHS